MAETKKMILEGGRPATAVYEENKTRTQVLAHNRNQGSTNTCVEHSIVNAMGLMDIYVSLEELQAMQAELEDLASGNLLKKLGNLLRFGVFNGPNTPLQQQNLIRERFPKLKTSVFRITTLGELVKILERKDQVVILTLFVPSDKKIRFEIFDARDKHWLRAKLFGSGKFPSTDYHAVTLVGYDPTLKAGKNGTRPTPWCLANSWTNEPELFCLSEEDMAVALGSRSLMLNNAVLIKRSGGH